MRITNTMGWILGATLVVACGGDDKPPLDRTPCDVDDGQCIFRHDTFGDEQLWTDVLRLHEVVQTLPPRALSNVGAARALRRSAFTTCPVSRRRLPPGTSRGTRAAP